MELRQKLIWKALLLLSTKNEPEKEEYLTLINPITLSVLTKARLRRHCLAAETGMSK